MAVQRDLGPSPSQSLTYEAVGIAEDYSSIITNISPEMTYFLSNFGEAPNATNLEFGWLTEGLKPPQQNAHLEKVDYESKKVGSIEGLRNYCQHFLNSGWVSDAQRKVKKLYTPEDEFERQRTKAFTEQAHDIEYALVNGDVSRSESGGNPAMSGGVPFFMQVQNLDATLDTTTGTLTTTVEHGLITGDFVYFTAGTMPTDLKANTIYYIRQDATDGAKKFTVFDTMKAAVENLTAQQVKPSTAGTGLKIVKNNVVDLGGSADYTVDDINNIMQMCYNRGGNPTEMVMSGTKKRRFSQIAAAVATTTRKSSEKKMELVVSSLETDFGLLNAKSHRMYPDNRIDFMDMNYWDLKWFDRTHEVTGLAKKGSYKEFVIEAWLGLQGTQPKASGSLLNVKR